MKLEINVLESDHMFLITRNKIYYHLFLIYRNRGSIIQEIN